MTEYNKTTQYHYTIIGCNKDEVEQRHLQTGYDYDRKEAVIEAKHIIDDEYSGRYHHFRIKIEEKIIFHKIVLNGTYNGKKNR